MALENAAQTYQLEQRVRRREGGVRRQAGTGIYECKDGEIYLLAGGIGETKLWNNFVRWLANEGVSGASVFEASPWSDPVYLSSAEAIGRFNAVFKPFANGAHQGRTIQRGTTMARPDCPGLRASRCARERTTAT